MRGNKDKTDRWGSLALDLFLIDWEDGLFCIQGTLTLIMFGQTKKNLFNYLCSSHAHRYRKH